MNELSTVYTYIKELFDGDSNVNNITRVPFEDIGIMKNPLYPFVNVDYTGCRYDDGMVIFKFTIYALSIRDKSKTPIENWWDNNDNRIDNQIITENILRRFIMIVENLENIYDIELISKTDLTAGMAIFTSVLDGHSFDIELGITNQYDCDVEPE
jgi:hypothetical protein